MKSMQACYILPYLFSQSVWRAR